MEIKEKLLKLHNNRKWRLNHLYYIKDEAGNNIKFRMNEIQKDFFDNIWFLNIILKARQHGFCLDPKTKILTADLKWKAISNLKIGDNIISVDEFSNGRGKGRRMRTAIVEGVFSVKREAFKITLDDGRELTCTGQHPWLTKKVATGLKWRTITDRGGFGRLKIGTKIRWITKPWGDSSVEDGWFGGIIDGEGSMNIKTKCCIGISQRSGIVLDRIRNYCDDNGYHYQIYKDTRRRVDGGKFGDKLVYRIEINRVNELFKLIGKTRPSRFLNNNFWQGKELPGKKTSIGWAKVIKIEKLGMRELIDLQTSTGTYIAEGFASHNTTLCCLLFLDSALFEMKDAGIIAHTLDDAKKIFDNKVQYAWDRLPDWLKSNYQVDFSNTRVLKLKRGDREASLYVGTSLRSSTNQNLLVTELGTLDQKYPEKSNEIMSGALNTIHAGQIVVIESTSKGGYGNFYNLCSLARNNLKEGKQLTEMDYKFFFYPWFYKSSYCLNENIVIPRELQEYFDKLELSQGIKLSNGQRAWYHKKSLIEKDTMKSEFPSTPEEAFLASIEGAYYGPQMDKIRERGRITKVPYDPALRVDTWWDLGVDDSTTIWFTQQVGLEIRLIDYYENSGEGLQHYLKILQDKLYIYHTHTAPHDIGVRELTTGKSRWETAQKLGINFLIAPKLAVIDGIQAVRNMLPRCWFDEKNCDKGIKALTEYRKEWNDKLGAYSNHPLHNWACLTGDTKVRTLKGWKEIKNINITDYVWGYSLKEHRLIPAKVIESKLTGENVDLIKIILDNGNEIKCTPEHLFLLRNENYKRAENLKVGDSLMPFYEKTSRQAGYKEIFLNDGSWTCEHRFVYSRFNNFLKTIGQTRIGYIIHHKDGDKENCNPENLEQLSVAEHCKNHIQEPERINKRNEALKLARLISHKKYKHICLECGSVFSAIKYAKYCSKNCKDRLNSRISRRKNGIVERKFKNHKVKNIIYLKEKGDVYDLCVPETKNFVAEGVVVHNSHGADAFRTLAIAIRDQNRFETYDEEILEMLANRDKPVNNPFNPLALQI